MLLSYTWLPFCHCGHSFHNSTGKKQWWLREAKLPNVNRIGYLVQLSIKIPCLGVFSWRAFTWKRNILRLCTFSKIYPSVWGAWKATVHGVAKSEHDWVTEHICLSLSQNLSVLTFQQFSFQAPVSQTISHLSWISVDPYAAAILPNKMNSCMPCVKSGPLGGLTSPLASKIQRGPLGLPFSQVLFIYFFSQVLKPFSVPFTISPLPVITYCCRL